MTRLHRFIYVFAAALALTAILGACKKDNSGSADNNGKEEKTAAAETVKYKAAKDFGIYELCDPSFTDTNQAIVEIFKKFKTVQPDGVNVTFANKDDIQAIRDAFQEAQDAGKIPSDCKLAVTFSPDKSWSPDENLYGLYILQGRPVITALDVLYLNEENNPELGGIAIFCRLNDDGAKVFSNVTRDNIGRQLAITVKGWVISAPYVNAAIDGGSIQISGDQSDMQEIFEMITDGKQ